MQLGRQFATFVVGGLVSAGVDIGTMQLLIKSTVPPMMAATFGFALGLLVNYAFHARVTFGAARTAGSTLRYLVVVAVNYLITVAMVAASVKVAGNALAGKIASLPVVAANGFLLSRYWVFR